VTTNAQSQAQSSLRVAAMDTKLQVSHYDIVLYSCKFTVTNRW